MRNYLVVLLRNLRRERMYAAINIAGLSLGVACCLILGLFLRSELSYDRHHLNHEHIYRVVNEFSIAGSNDRFAVTSRQLGPMLAADYPEIKAVVRFQRNGNEGGIAIRHGEDVFYWKDTYFVSDNVFDVFTHKVIYGDPKTALKETGSVAVSETFSKKYFGNANPVGESITTDAGIPQKITLVFADLPANTHMKYDMLYSDNISFLQGPDNSTQRRQQLFNVGNFTYLLMAPGFDPKSWARINDEFFNRYMADTAKQINASWKSWLQPLADVHLKSDVGYDLPTGNLVYLYGCAAVAAFILLVACINYMNLATARALRRARSVGIRKILGASRLSLGLQFMGEAVMFSVIALVLGVVIVEMALTLTPINGLMGEQVRLDLLTDHALLGWIVGLGIVIGVLSGLYPAFYLSSWAPLTALTGKHLAGKGNLRLREVLVLLQFTVSAAVIACTLLMGAQMRYVANKALGFEREHRLLVTLRGVPTLEKVPTIRIELAKNSHILGVSEGQSLIGQTMPINVVQIENNAGAMSNNTITHMPIGENFVPVMGIKVLEGRDFSKRLLTDVGTNFLVNEALVHKMGWASAIGKRMQFGQQQGRVIGVVGDFNFKSLRTLIEPFAMYPLDTDYSQIPPVSRPFLQHYLVLKVSSDDLPQTLNYIESVMTQADAKHPFEYTFLDDSLDKLYKSDNQLLKLIAIFATVCIFIACLGLFGLAAFTTEQRTREIGTRKVLGATTMQIILLLSRRILVLVLIAAVFASVLAYFSIDKWLEGFAYKAGVNPLIFLLSAAAAAAVAFGTVALQSFKTARADPVEALRHV